MYIRYAALLFNLHTAKCTACKTIYGVNEGKRGAILTLDTKCMYHTLLYRVIDTQFW